MSGERDVAQPVAEASAHIDARGVGVVVVGGVTRELDEQSADAARARIMRTVLDHARDSRRSVVLTAHDSQGTTCVAVHPDGRAEVITPSPPASPALLATGPSPIAYRKPLRMPAPHERISGQDHIEHAVLTARSASTTWLFTFAGGGVATVWGTGLVGRRPPQNPTQPRDHCIAIDDETRTVSRLHLEFGTDSGRLWISDCGSTNGTRLIRGREVIDCEGQRRYWAAPGTLVEMGDQGFTVALGEAARA